MILLQPIAIGLHLGQARHCNSGRIVRSPARLGGPQIVLRPQQLALRLGEPRCRILDLQFQQQLPLLHCLPFVHAHFLHKRIQLRSHHVRCEGLDLAIAADGRDQVFAHRRHRGNLGHRLSPAQPHPSVRQHSRQQQVQQDSVSHPAIHTFLFCAVPRFALLKAQGHIPQAQRFSYLSVACLTPVR